MALLRGKVMCWPGFVFLLLLGFVFVLDVGQYRLECKLVGGVVVVHSVTCFDGFSCHHVIEHHILLGGTLTQRLCSCCCCGALHFCFMLGKTGQFCCRGALWTMHNMVTLHTTTACYSILVMDITAAEYGYAVQQSSFWVHRG
jgi:hypothetical protein